MIYIPWPDMTPREQDATLSIAMGNTVRWRLCEPEPDGDGRLIEIEWWYDKHPQADREGLDREPCILLRISEPHDVYELVPSFTASLDAMRLVEDVIEGRGLQDAYIDALMHIVGFSAIGATTDDFWALLRATPAQRAEAAYTVLRDERAHNE